VEKFEKDMKDPELEKAVAKDLKDGADAQVSGTPSLYINGKRVMDRSFEGLKKMIDEELSKGGAAASKTK
jgi:protein-disulfide isomerase